MTFVNCLKHNIKMLIKQTILQNNENLLESNDQQSQLHLNEKNIINLSPAVHENQVPFHCHMEKTTKLVHL